MRDGDTWSEQAYLKASNVENADRFGNAVAISGDSIIVGANEEDGNGSRPDDNSAGGAGAAYVFVRDGNIWSEQAYLKASNVENADNFGNAVAIDGNTAVVGAYEEDGNGSSPDDNSEETAGAAYVFVRVGDAWTEQAYLKAPNPHTEDEFSTVVAVDGNIIVVGVPYGANTTSDPDSGTTEGAAHVYIFDGIAWNHEKHLEAHNADRNDNLGFGVAISGDTILVGASNERQQNGSFTR